MKAFNLLPVVAGITALVSASALAGVPKDLPYPSGGNLTADQVADQVYFVNHFYSLGQFGITEKDKDITVLVNKSKGEKPTTITVERYLNNEVNDGIIKAQDLAIFTSGKLKGTGMLITDYVDDSKSQQYSIWLPALRKIRRFAEPAHDDAWGGTDFTFGDVTLRKPQHETHELLGKETFNDCLGFITLTDDEKNRYMQDLPAAGSCDAKGKEVYKLKSTTKYQNWWYDYRISYVDTKTFADYRTDYFKGDKKIKVIDRDWGNPATDDPRSVVWKYWYGTTFDTGHETWAYIPPSVVEINPGHDQDMWSEKTLTKIKR